MSVQYCLVKLCQRWQDAGYNPGYDIELAKRVDARAAGIRPDKRVPRLVMALKNYCSKRL